MRVSKHQRKKDHHKSKQLRPTKWPSATFTEHPFSAVPHETLKQKLLELGHKHKFEFPNRLKSLENSLQTLSPISTISVLATYGLFGTINIDGEPSAGYKGEEFNQSHVELIQALFLQISYSAQAQKTPSTKIVHSLFDVLPELATTYHLRRLSELEKELSEEAKAIRLIQEGLRLNTQAVRNWSYLSRVVAITKRICAPIDRISESTIGVSNIAMIDLFAHLIKRNERLVNEHLKVLSHALTARTVPDVINAYYKILPPSENSKAEMLAFAEEKSFTLEQLKSILLSHSDLSLPDIYTFDAATLTSETGIDLSLATIILDRLSISFGEIADVSSEGFFLENPVWMKPVIKLSSGKYFCAIPQTFFSFIFPILREVFSLAEVTKKLYETRRAAFLESEICQLFTKAFPGCEIGTGYKWREGSVTYENDLMIRVDSFLLLVEAKSHSISWSALRGAPDRARKHVEQILLDPSIQSMRLATRVTKAIYEKQNVDVLLPNFPVALAQVSNVIRLSVTLEDFASLQTTIHQMKKTNWIPATHSIAPCILLADLEIVFDILETTHHKIHYLKRRADLEAHFDYQGDELDLLGFYLATGFNENMSRLDARFLATSILKAESPFILFSPDIASLY